MHFTCRRAEPAVIIAPELIRFKERAGQQMNSSTVSDPRIERLEQNCSKCVNPGSCLGFSRAQREAALNRAMLAADGGAKTPLLLSGDRPIIRGALHALLDTRPEFQVVIEAAICSHMMRVCEELNVKVAVVDLDLVDSDQEALKLLHLVIPASEGDPEE